MSLICVWVSSLISIGNFTLNSGDLTSSPTVNCNSLKLSAVGITGIKDFGIGVTIGVSSW